MMSEYIILSSQIFGSVDPLPKALDRGTASVAIKTGAFFISCLRARFTQTSQG